MAQHGPESWTIIIQRTGPACSRICTTYLAILILIFVYTINYCRNRYHIKIVKMVIPSCLIVLLSIFLLYKGRPDSADSRILIWKLSSKMVSDNLLIGKGLGYFESTYMYKQAEFFAANPESKYILVSNNQSHPYNEFLHILVNTGLIGLLLLAAIVLIVFMQSGELYNSLSIIALLIYATFNNITSEFALLLYFPIFLAFSAKNSVEILRINVKMQLWSTIIISLFFLSVSCLTYDYYNRYSFAKKLLFSDYVINNQKNSKNLKSLKIIEQNKNISLVYLKKVLNCDSISNPEKIDIYKRLSKTTANSEIICDLGDLYFFNKEYLKAEECYKLSYNMIPCRIVPSYKLFKLYDYQGDNQKAVFMAIRISDQNVSVVSSLTLRIRNEVRNYINNLSSVP